MAWNPFYTEFIWPFAHITKTVTVPDDDIPQKNEALPVLDLMGNVTSMLGAIRSFILASFCVFYAPKLHGMEYPAFGSAKTFTWDWMWPIFFRNILSAWVICGFWDWFLYFSPFKQKLHKYKMNHKYPSMAQFKHDAFYTTLTICWAAIMEILLCHWWAKGALTMQHNLADTPVRNIIVALTITHWRVPHFHIFHRMMHPWRTSRIPDVGKFLYRHVHSRHHKSYNPTAFSGTNMHPVEGILFNTVSLIPVFFGLHPVFAVAVSIDAAMGAWLGHDGFQWPGSGDYFHMLHHQHFDCNYGALHVPLDWLFGTFIGCKDDLKKVWKETPSGADADDTAMHRASTKDDKVE